MNGPRVWTLEQANAMIPRLSTMVQEQLVRASDIERLWEKLQDARKGTLGPASNELEAELRRRVDTYEQGWRDVEALGVVVKDPRIGLCDFYGRVEGKLVWLCWRFGEPAIEHYHSLDEGFAGRKAIAGATKQRLLN